VAGFTLEVAKSFVVPHDMDLLRNTFGQGPVEIPNWLFPKGYCRLTKIRACQGLKRAHGRRRI